MLFRDKFVTYCQNFDLKLRMDYQNNSYDRRDYESVDEKKPVLGYVPKKQKTN